MSDDKETSLAEALFLMVLAILFLVPSIWLWGKCYASAWNWLVVPSFSDAIDIPKLTVTQALVIAAFLQTILRRNESNSESAGAKVVGMILTPLVFWATIYGYWFFLIR